MRIGPAEMADNDLAADQKNIISRKCLEFKFLILLGYHSQI